MAKIKYSSIPELKISCDVDLDNYNISKELSGKNLFNRSDLKVGDKVVYIHKTRFHSDCFHIGDILTIKEILKISDNMSSDYYCEKDNGESNYFDREEISFYFDLNDLVNNEIQKIKETHKMKINNEGDKNMEILEIYEERKRKEINERYDKMYEELYNNDIIQQILQDAANQINVMLDKDEEEAIEVHASSIEYTKETNEKMEKINLDREQELQELKNKINEVKAWFKMTINFEERVKILQKYDIIDKSMKIKK